MKKLATKENMKLSALIILLLSLIMKPTFANEQSLIEEVDTVRTIEKSKDSVKVTFFMMAAFYKAASKDTALIKTLEESKKSGKKLKLSIDPVALTIIKATPSKE